MACSCKSKTTCKVKKTTKCNILKVKCKLPKDKVAKCCPKKTSKKCGKCSKRCGCGCQTGKKCKC